MISLLEFLQSANKDKFISILKKQYPEDIDDIYDNSNNLSKSWGSEVVFVESENPFYLLCKTDFVKFCRRYQWVPTFIKWFQDTDVLSIILEPISKITKHFDVVYHLTPREYYDKFIKYRGLCPIGTISNRWSKKDYEAFTDSTIYQHSGNIKDGYRSILPKVFVFSDLKDFDEISKQIGADSDYVVLKIDVSGHKNFIFYKDTANPDSVSAYYTFEHIPKQLITIDNELTEKLQHI